MTYAVDRYVLDTLMADLVGHDRRPSAFLVYLAIIAASGSGRSAALSHAQLAESTGLSRRGAQDAVRLLDRRGLIAIRRDAPTGVTQYAALAPWRR